MISWVPDSIRDTPKLFTAKDGHAGASPSSEHVLRREQMETDRDHSIKPRFESLAADLIVIGSGASGLAAALTAAEGGAKVIILEKMDIPGGSSNIPSGPFAVESRLQRRTPQFRLYFPYHYAALTLAGPQTIAA